MKTPPRKLGSHQHSLLHLTVSKIYVIRMIVAGEGTQNIGVPGWTHMNNTDAQDNISSKG